MSSVQGKRAVPVGSYHVGEAVAWAGEVRPPFPHVQGTDQLSQAGAWAEGHVQLLHRPGVAGAGHLHPGRMYHFDQ